MEEARGTTVEQDAAGIPIKLDERRSVGSGQHDCRCFSGAGHRSERPLSQSSPIDRGQRPSGAPSRSRRGSIVSATARPDG